MSHETAGKSNEWYTPKYIFDALMCRFDLDVAAPKDRKKIHVPADQFISENSLKTGWNEGSESNFVWMNPPFGNQKNKFEWIDRFIRNGNGIALMPDRTSAPWWQHFSEHADCVLFVSGKIKFIDENGNTGESPSNGTTLFGIGSRAIRAMRKAEGNGLGKLYLSHKNNPMP